MRLEFASRRLERCFDDPAFAERTWGPVVGRAFVRRIEFIESVVAFEDLREFAMSRLHRLRGPREGSFAIDLHARWRLVVRPIGPSAILIEEVSNHYDD